MRCNVVRNGVQSCFEPRQGSQWRRKGGWVWEGNANIYENVFKKTVIAKKSSHFEVSCFVYPPNKGYFRDKLWLCCLKFSNLGLNLSCMFGIFGKNMNAVWMTKFSEKLKSLTKWLFYHLLPDPFSPLVVEQSFSWAGEPLHSRDTPFHRLFSPLVVEKRPKWALFQATLPPLCFLTTSGRK